MLNYEYREDLELENEQIIEKMHKRKCDFLTTLNRYIHPLYVEEFSKILHYSWQENLAEAQIIADNFDLHEIDFAALALDKKEFTELLRKEDEYHD